jgi:hypothetical protein
MDNLHLQASYGSSSNANGGAIGNEGEDYTVMDLGAKYTMDPLTLKFEYIAGSNVRGVDGWDETVMFVHGGYMLNDSTELVARHYMGTDDQNGTETDLSNTYVGANFFMNDAMRIQANYVAASGDTDGAYGGARGGYDANAILTQFQYMF